MIFNVGVSFRTGLSYLLEGSHYQQAVTPLVVPEVEARAGLVSPAGGLLLVLLELVPLGGETLVPVARHQAALSVSALWSAAGLSSPWAAHPHNKVNWFLPACGPERPTLSYRPVHFNQRPT